MPARSRRRRVLRGIFRWLARGLLLLVLTSVCVVGALRWIDPPTSAFMLRDNSGHPVRHEWVSWRGLGSAAALAVVAAEDQRFAEHFGLDLDSIRNSVRDYAAGDSLRGASTITQQVAKNLFLWPGRSLIRKSIEAYLAVLIELTWTKQRILEVYLNIAEFGPGIYGVGAASAAYFGKRPHHLSDADAALLAAVLPNPRRLSAGDPSDYVRERQRWILRHVQRLRREGWLTGITR